MTNARAEVAALRGDDGPVVSIVGNEVRVRGVVCGDVSENAENGAAGSGHRAYASALWPLMGVRTNIELLNPDGSPHIAPHGPLLEWARQGRFDDRGAVHEHLRLVGREDGTEAFTYGWNPEPRATAHQVPA